MVIRPVYSTRLLPARGRRAKLIPPRTSPRPLPMPEPLRCVPPTALIAGWDFSTGAVKCLAFDLTGTVVAEVRLPTDLWTEGGVSELNLMQLEGQARASVRAIADQLRDLGRLDDWARRRHLGHAPHRRPHRRRRQPGPPGDLLERPDPGQVPRRGAGTARRAGAGPGTDRRAVGGPVLAQPPRQGRGHAPRGGLEADASGSLPHGPLAAGYLTGRFDCISVSSAASTGIMDLRTERSGAGRCSTRWPKPDYRELAWTSLPRSST